MQRACDKCRLVNLLLQAETHLPCAAMLLQQGYFIIKANMQLGIVVAKKDSSTLWVCLLGAPC